MVIQSDDLEDFPFDDGPPHAAAGDASPGPDRPEPPDRSDGEPEDWERVREARRERRARHERVLHTRISEQLSDDIRRAADDLRVPVSNLVRNVLEEAFGAVERVSDEVGEFLEEVLGDAEGARADLRRLRRRVSQMARSGRRRVRERFADAVDEAGPDDEGQEEAGPDEAPPARRDARFDRVDTEVREQRAEPSPAPAAQPAAFPDVLGWQPLLANAAAPCADCGRTLARGERIFVGATERGLSRTFLCGECMRARGGA